MNIQQFQYVLALAEYRHFQTAAEKCFVSQSTLSTMIGKLEEELGIKIFDRKTKPVGLSREGVVLLQQMKRISKEIDSLQELTQELKGEIKGSLSISVIPTIAPFLLPRFLSSFAEQYPDLQIDVREQNTAEIVRGLRSRELDIGILSTPIREEELVEHHLYDEPFVFFNMEQEKRGVVHSKNIDVSRLCLLEEGHCMRTQILSLCDYYEKELNVHLHFRFRAGSVHSLLRFVIANRASTLLPYLASLELDAEHQKKLSHFEAPRPYRRVGLVVHRHFVKHKLRKLLQKEIEESILPLLDDAQTEGLPLFPL